MCAFFQDILADGHNIRLDSRKKKKSLPERKRGQGEPRHRKYKWLKLGGGQAYNISSDDTAVVAGATNDKA
jgi:hypothetical protein